MEVSYFRQSSCKRTAGKATGQILTLDSVVVKSIKRVSFVGAFLLSWWTITDRNLQGFCFVFTHKIVFTHETGEFLRLGSFLMWNNTRKFASSMSFDLHPAIPNRNLSRQACLLLFIVPQWSINYFKEEDAQTQF